MYVFGNEKKAKKEQPSKIGEHFHDQAHKVV
jgi:hypothetical protein